MTNGLGPAAVFDFVGTEADLMIAGLVGGALPFGYGTTAHDVAARCPYWGSRSEFLEVLEPSCSGVLTVAVEAYTLDEGPEAYGRLQAGKIRGCGVITLNV